MVQCYFGKGIFKFSGPSGGHEGKDFEVGIFFSGADHLDSLDFRLGLYLPGLSVQSLLLAKYSLKFIEMHWELVC